MMFLVVEQGFINDPLVPVPIIHQPNTQRASADY